MDQKILIAIIVGAILLIIVGFVFMKKKDNYAEAPAPTPSMINSIFGTLLVYPDGSVWRVLPDGQKTLFSSAPTPAPTPAPTSDTAPHTINSIFGTLLVYPDGSVWRVLPDGQKTLFSAAPTPAPTPAPTSDNPFAKFFG